MAVGQPHFFRGYHPQGTIGPFGATAAAGRMLRLDADQMQHALGLAGSQSGGLMAAQEGAMVKRLHSGRAGQSGVMSALLARRGFTGISDALEAGFGGFCTTFAGDQADGAKLTDGLGKKWEILNIGFKQYSTAASIHTTLDVAKDLMTKYRFTADDCEKIVVHATTMTWIHCCFHYEPRGVAGAQMNLLFGLACMLRHGDAFVDQFTEEMVSDPATIEFIHKRIETMPDEELDKAGALGRHAIWMEVWLKDGRRVTGRADQRKGSPQNPMSRADIQRKYRNLASRILPEKRVNAIEELVLDLENVKDVRELSRLLVS
jgi:2-methylcitrate dehydratase PrpD